MRHISKCLNSKLITICQRAIELEALSTIVYSYLPETLREHCQIGSFRNGCLNLVTHDPVWASELRYRAPELRDKLRSDASIYQLASIKITIDAQINTLLPENNHHSKIDKQPHLSPLKALLDGLTKENI